MNLATKKIITNTPFKTYARLFKSLNNYKFAFFLAILGIIIASGAEAIIYKFIVPPLFDEGVIVKNAIFLQKAPWYILAAFSGRGLGDFIGKYFMAYVGRNVVKQQRIMMLHHMLYLPISFFDNHTTGELVSKINYDAEQVATALSDAVLELLKGMITVLFLLMVIFSISWQITITVLIIGPIVSSYFKAISKRIRRYSLKVQNTMGKVTNVTNEIINGHKVIRGFQGEAFESKRIEQIISNNCQQEIKIALVMACSEPIMQFIGAASLAFFVYFATLQSWHISPGEFIGLFTAMFGLIRPIKQITQVNNVLQRGIAAADSIHQLLDIPQELDAGTYCFTKAKGKLCFNKVSFAYSNITRQPEQHVTLRDISFIVNPGETIALVGSSGSGKSTLVALIARFYEITQGKILLDDIDIKDIKLINLRQQLAIVTQNVILFNDTIANNIAYGQTAGFTKDQVIKAATAAHVMEFAAKLPAGLDTIVGQDGVLLSGGQRQRIAIARALLKQAPILILDEATSALDNESERYIQEALNNISHQCTTLIVAHRLSTIETADKILVLEQGCLVEFGTHAALIAKKNSRYAALYQSQFQKNIN